jgi:hypothetical protein
MVMKHIQTFESVNEAVKVEVERYKRSHQKNPSGFGSWAFSYNQHGIGHFFTPQPMNYKEAVKWAKEEAKRDGEGYIYVMESVNEGINKSALKKQIKIIDKQIDDETGGDGEPLTDETLQALEIERARLKKLLGESVNEGVIGIKTEGGFKPKDLSDALDKAKVKYKMNRLSTTLTVLNLDKNYFEDAKKIVDDLGLNIMMAKESVNEGLSVTFEFPDERKAKQFNLDIENSAIGLGDQDGNRVTVTDVDPKWRSTVKKHMKKNGGKPISESVDEASQPPTDATIKPHMSQYSVSDDPYDVAEELGKEYGWSQAQIEKAEKLIRKKYIKESVNEAKEVEVTQEMWDKEWKIRKTFGKEYDEHFAKRIEAAMSKAKNEEMAENWAFINWKQLPGKADGMTIKESLNEGNPWAMEKAFAKKGVNIDVQDLENDGGFFTTTQVIVNLRSLN